VRQTVAGFGGQVVVRRESDTPAFVGRRHELELLDRWLDEAVAGRPRVVLVSGEVGVDRSRLVRELQHPARTERDVETCARAGVASTSTSQIYFVSALLPRLDSMTRQGRAA
jgi:AAA ATPase-like protein